MKEYVAAGEAGRLPEFEKVRCGTGKGAGSMRLEIRRYRNPG